MIFSTSLAVLTLSGLLGTNLAVQPTWQTDYRTARALSVEQHKPLAVFITKGPSAALPQLTDETAKVLKANYVVLTINSDDEAGKNLAQAFEMTEGVVVSDRTGEKQALRIEGQTNLTDLSQTLARLAEPNRTTTTTEVHGTPAATPVMTSAPVMTAAPTIASQIVPAYYSSPAPVCKSCPQKR